MRWRRLHDVADRMSARHAIDPRAARAPVTSDPSLGRGGNNWTPGSPRVTAVALLVGAVALMLVGWGLGQIAVSVAQPADLDAVRDLAAGRTGSLITVAHALSWLGNGFVVFPLAAILCVALYRRRQHRAALVLAVSTIGAVLIYNLDKLLVGRARPPVHHLEHVISESFPSGHSTQAAAVYGALLTIFLASRPRWSQATLAVLATAILVTGIALSRVYLGVHYPTDITAGALLGASWSWAVSRLLGGGLSPGAGGGVG